MRFLSTWAEGACPGEMLLRMKDQYAVPRVDNAQVALDDAEVSAQNVQQNGSQEDRIQLAAETAKAQTERDQAAKALAAMKQIQANGSVTEAEVDAATERLQVAEANLRATYERLTNRYSEQDRQSWKDRIAADKATLQAEKVSWANANVASPIAGTVYALSAAQYDFVPAGADLLHVADMSHVQIRADFEEPDVGKLFIGPPVTVMWDGQPGRTWRGHLESKPLAVTSAQERSIGHCIVALDDDPGDLPLDTNVGVTVSVEKHSHVLTIPRAALRTDGAQHFVYRVIDGKLKRTPVETGLVNAMSAEITKGISPQDTVVLHAMNNRELVEKQPVTVVN